MPTIHPSAMLGPLISEVPYMEVQSIIVTAGYELWFWTAALSKSHLIAMAACFAFGYWKRGKQNDQRNSVE